MKMNKKMISTIALMTVAVATGCQSSSDDAVVPSVVVAVTPKTLYVASGACFSGAGTTSYVAAAGATAASKIISKYNADTGDMTGVFLDYNLGYFVAGTAPTTMIDLDDSIMVSNENGAAGNRAIVKLPKSDPTAFKTYYANATALSAQLRHFARDSDGSLLIARSTAIEKITNAPQRALINTFAWVTPTVGTCGASNTLMSAVALLPAYTAGGATNGKIIFAHAGGAAATNRIGIVQESGWSANVAIDCLASSQTNVVHTFASNIPQRTWATAVVGPSPTSMVYIPTTSVASITGRLIVTVANNVTSNSLAGVYNFNHGIVSWDINETAYGTVAISNPVVLYDNASVVYGPSAITYDSASTSIYVGVGGEPGVAAANFATNNVPYNVEKFTYSLSANTLTRVAPNNQPFVQGTAITKCVSGLIVGD